MDDLQARVGVGIARGGCRQAGSISPSSLGILQGQCRDERLAGLFRLASAQAGYGGLCALRVFPSPLVENHIKRRVSLTDVRGCGDEHERALRVFLCEGRYHRRANLHLELRIGQRIREGKGPGGIFRRDAGDDDSDRILAHSRLLDPDRKFPCALWVGFRIGRKNKKQSGLPSTGRSSRTHLRSDGGKVGGLQPLLQIGVFFHGIYATASTGLQAGEFGAEGGGGERHKLLRFLRILILKRWAGHDFLHSASYGGSAWCTGGNGGAAKNIPRPATYQAGKNNGDECCGVFIHSVGSLVPLSEV